MDFVSICIAILLWLVRPQDWLAGMAGFGFMRYTMVFALFGAYTRPGGFRTSLLFQSPTDLLIVMYLGWIVVTTGDYFTTAKEVLPFVVFYYSTALALNTPRRLQIFLKCWIAGLVVVAVFALSTALDAELAPGSAYLTASFGGRLTLNTWIFNNPNSLGHGVVLLISLCYVWFWWKRPVRIRLVGCVLAGLAAYCVVLTESKGAYLCGAGALGIVFLFRKRLIWQVLILALALSGGIAALKLLPRMNTLKANEDGIAGRLLIWQMAHSAMANTHTGEGWKKFQAWITIPNVGVIHKATHGSYVNVGADLGYPGLLLFVAILYANGRTVLLARPKTQVDISDRNQRGLLALLCGYAASATMIDRAYHTDFFLIAGAISAFHRQMTGQASGVVDEPVLDNVFTGDERFSERREINVSEQFTPNLVFQKRDLLSDVMSGRSLQPAAMAVGNPGSTGLVTFAGTRSLASLEDRPPLNWRRLTVVDLCLIGIFFAGVLYAWAEVMIHFVTL